MQPDYLFAGGWVAFTVLVAIGIYWEYRDSKVLAVGRERILNPEVIRIERLKKLSYAAATVVMIAICVSGFVLQDGAQTVYGFIMAVLSVVFIFMIALEADVD